MTSNAIHYDQLPNHNALFWPRLNHIHYYLYSNHNVLIFFSIWLIFKKILYGNI